MRQGNETETCNLEDYVKPPSKNIKDLQVQLVLSLVLGLSALVAFCVLRPRWPSLYSARKRRLDPAVGLPALPKTFLGWIPRLYRVSEEQVLAAAGLDAFVFLTFFKMAIRLFVLMAFFAIAVLWPINYHYRHFQPALGGNHTAGNESLTPPPLRLAHLPLVVAIADAPEHEDKSRERTYLWAYVVFTYLFVALTTYSINRETFRIIDLRQHYLGSQSTITDRTFRLTGIPPNLRSEDALKSMIEKLDIGLVDTVTLCRNWKELDRLVERRRQILRQLEVAWAKYRGRQRTVSKQHSDSTQTDRNGDPSQHRIADLADGWESREANEHDQLLGGQHAMMEEQSHLVEGDRPQISVRYGPLKLRSRHVDAIDYYEEKLRRIDEQVMEARDREYEATDMALVTMDSVASCQMVIQARIDPRPGQLLTKPTPSPSDLVWKNTYAPRILRRFQSWSITLFITFLTLIWIFPTAILASWLSICTIKRVLPSFSNWLAGHPIIHSLFQNGIPTLVVSLLNVAVPYLYDWLSNHQGMISQGDVELSVISKNFFFTFFNTFFVFAVSRTGFDFWSTLQGFLKDTSQIPAAIAADVEDLSIFYISFIMLQGIGLMPFRILEVGSVFLYPFLRMMSSTPRDFAELEKPPAFQYGYYLPTALLVFNLCLIYSVLRWGFAILFFGTIYFVLGYFTFKYMLLYAMDQPQHATGGAWRIICHRIVIGLVVFEVVMLGQIASLAAFVQSVAILPLIPFTIWYSYYFRRRFEPLTKYIALQAITKVGSPEAVDDETVDDAFESSRQARASLRRGSTLDEFRERGLTFVNPSLVSPLQPPWIYQDPPTSLDAQDLEEADGRPQTPLLPSPPPPSQPSRATTLILPSPDSSLGIGEDNVWRDSARGGR